MRNKDITTTYKQYSLVQVDTNTVRLTMSPRIVFQIIILSNSLKPGCLGNFSPAQMILLLVQIIKYKGVFKLNLMFINNASYTMINIFYQN